MGSFFSFFSGGRRDSQDGRSTNRQRQPVKLLWVKNPGGGPVDINADGSLSISDVPATRVTKVRSEGSIETNGDIVEESLRFVFIVEISSTTSDDPSPSDLWRNIVEYIERPPGAVVAIQSQPYDKLFIMGSLSMRPHVYGEEPDGGFMRDTRVWWRPVVFDKYQNIILLQYYSKNYQYPPDDPKSLYLVVVSSGREFNFDLRPRMNATTDGQFQWGTVES